MTNPKSKNGVPSGPPKSLDVRIAESPPALAADVAELFTHLAQQAAGAGKPFRVALSGGSTPRLLYGLLASDTFRGEIPWDSIRFFFGDERWVPQTSRDCNYKSAKDELFSKLELNPEHVFPIPTEGVTPDESAARYEAILRKESNLKRDEVPRFDLILLGMGDDGHTASLFPHTSALHERDRLVVPNFVEKLSAQRITLTAPVLTAAKEVIFLITGESKAPALREVLEGKYNPEEYPAQLLRNALGKVIWYVDRPAASQLQSRYTQV